MTPSEAPKGERRRRALALSLVPGLGPVKWRELSSRHGSAAAAFDAEVHGERRDAALRAADEALASAERIGARLLLPGDGEYPPPVLDLSDAPTRLFVLGDVVAARPPAVAIVGTRGATAAGERAAAELASAFARAGAAVVSGLARGIDGAAHRGALQAGGRTVAVLGTGVDVPYPAAHAALHADVARGGALLSEELPGAPPTKGSFPRRNRIIAALADLTIVVEAPPKSGALITAGVALDLGRQVAAVPGSIHAPQSRGSNELLRDGATVLTSIDEALALLSLQSRAPAAASPPAAAPAAAAPVPSLGPAPDAVLDALRDGPLDPDRLAAETGLPARECLAAVTALELAGAVLLGPAGEIRRV